ncbi:hypothetical protein QZM22_11220 [Burkholderia oklahomensis]|uniref:hypothetical protein n=1 Tax=Burkholderia oklahomensis TaxID=342113 RepID=UPI00264AB9C5|nr:hypothetical protein [Burkholderia oklahomensis]MDN7673074.1 hypothetical protein [Burkholderia oklahomensis]
MQPDILFHRPNPPISDIDPEYAPSDHDDDDSEPSDPPEPHRHPVGDPPPPDPPIHVWFV